MSFNAKMADLEYKLLKRDLLRSKLAKETIIQIIEKEEKEDKKGFNIKPLAFSLCFIASVSWAIYERSKGFEISDQLILASISIFGVIFSKGE